MIELYAKPVVESVALFTTGGESRRDMVGPVRSLEIFRVTRVASGRESLELPHSRTLMTRVAIERRMCPHQREAVLVVLDLLYRDLPSLHRVALLAVGAELAFVNVGVAVGAPGGNIAEDQLGVARGARHFLVHAAQRISSLVVVKLRHAADRLPSAEGVAVLAWNVQRSVWTVRARCFRRGAHCAHEREQQQTCKRPDDVLKPRQSPPSKLRKLEPDRN